ncbi:hypothetical protein K474DRAFT_500607 [Panus rudis PR-1116 ss-1]|nr:hypothetical protein K474DRAFT_500607 [Panus rudis PR-1116 ss-1]
MDDTKETRVSPSASTPHSITILRPPTRTHTHATSFHPVHNRTLSFPLTHHRPAPTFRPTADPPANTDSQPRSHRQSTVAIVFETFAGIIGLIFFILFMRCIYRWKTAPPRDRIAALLSRHQLEREMEELEREQIARRARRGSIIRPPPPPYQHAPAYETVIQSPPPV